MEAPAVHLSSDRLETVLEDGEFILYRIGGAVHTTTAHSALVVMPRSEHPRPQALRGSSTTATIGSTCRRRARPQREP